MAALKRSRLDARRNGEQRRCMVHFDCPEKDSLRDSYAIEETEKQSQKGQASTSANNCKWDSTAASGREPTAPTTRVSDCQGSRAADGRRAQTRAP
jgi:hypothetical protein